MSASESASDWTCLQIMHDMGFPQYQYDLNGSQGYKYDEYTSTDFLKDRTELSNKTRESSYNPRTEFQYNQEIFYKAINVINTVLNCDDGSPLNKKPGFKFWISNFKYNGISGKGHLNYSSNQLGGTADGTRYFLKNLLESEEIKSLKKSETDNGKDLKFSELKKALEALHTTSKTLDKEILKKVLEGFDLIAGFLKDIRPSFTQNVDLLETLKTSKQLILQGPPGTGKTREAKILAAQIIGCKPETDTEENLADTEEFMIDAAERELKKQNPRIRMVQFHPSYGYEDFIAGISIDVQKNQMCAKNGILKNFAAEAENHSNENYVLIIDEINRAPLASVLGELLYALEYRGKKIIIQSADPSDNELCIPNKLYIIGTMNTADRSLSSMDYALRRRFAFAQLESKQPSDAELNEMTFDSQCYEQVKKLFQSGVLIKGIDRRDIMPGQSYFIIRDEKHMEYKRRYELAPMLTEYYKDGFFRKQAEVGGQRICAIFQNTESIVQYLNTK